MTTKTLLPGVLLAIVGSSLVVAEPALSPRRAHHLNSLRTTPLIAVDRVVREPVAESPRFRANAPEIIEGTARDLMDRELVPVSPRGRTLLPTRTAVARPAGRTSVY